MVKNVKYNELAIARGVWDTLPRSGKSTRDELDGYVRDELRGNVLLQDVTVKLRTPHSRGWHLVASAKSALGRTSALIRRVVLRRGLSQTRQRAES